MTSCTTAGGCGRIGGRTCRLRGGTACCDGSRGCGSAARVITSSLATGRRGCRRNRVSPGQCDCSRRCPADAATVITVAAGPASGRAVADQRGRMRSVGGDIVEGQARCRYAAPTTAAAGMTKTIAARTARCGLIKAKRAPGRRTAYRVGECAAGTRPATARKPAATGAPGLDGGCVGREARCAGRGVAGNAAGAAETVPVGAVSAIAARRGCYGARDTGAIR